MTYPSGSHWHCAETKRKEKVAEEKDECPMLKPQHTLIPVMKWRIGIGALLLSLCFSGFGRAQNATGNNIWQDVKESFVVVSGPRAIVPQSYRTVHLDSASLSQLLEQAPLEFTEAARKSP